jgi:hypothetical protein
MEADRALADSFDAPSDDEGSGDEKDGDDRRRLLHSGTSPSPQPGAPEGYGPHGFRTRRPPAIERRVTQFPTFTTEASPAAPGRVYGGGSHANDGVFANLSAKPEKGEKAEEHPPVSVFRKMYCTLLTECTELRASCGRCDSTILGDNSPCSGYGLR